MADLGMTFAELRVVGGKNIIDHTDAEIDQVKAKVEARGMRVLSIASPVLKCTLPDAPPVAPHIQQDMFSSASGFDDQPRLARRAFEIADRMGARIVRVFSYWRTIDPDACFERVASALRELADEALKRNLIVGIENEHACNIASGAESAQLLAAVDHPALQVIWDPANALVTGETPYPAGLRAPSGLANRARAREGLHGYQSRAHVGAAGRDGHRLARAARRARRRWLPRRHQPRDTLERAERR